jgi:hypothetical protein
MQIVERYLHAIEFWLPKEQSHDILAEISEDILSQIEDRQEQLGRPLNDSELELLIKQRGRPVLVANRYLPQRSLIGPVLFPIYLFVLKVFALCYLLPWAAVFLTVHRVQHPAAAWSDTVGAAWGASFTAAFLGAGIITMVFATLQFLETRNSFLSEWNPRQLPPARHPGKIPRAASTIELVLVAVALIWWTTRASSLEILQGPALRVTLSPVWIYFFWAGLALILANAALSSVNLLRPYWTALRALARLAIDGAGAALFCWLLKAGVLARLDIAGVDPSRAIQIKDAIQLWMERAFPFAVIGVIVILGFDIYRVIWVTRGGAAMKHEALAMLT